MMDLASDLALRIAYEVDLTCGVLSWHRWQHLHAESRKALMILSPGINHPSIAISSTPHRIGDLI